MKLQVCFALNIPPKQRSSAKSVEGTQKVKSNWYMDLPFCVPSTLYAEFLIPFYGATHATYRLRIFEVQGKTTTYTRKPLYAYLGQEGESGRNIVSASLTVMISA